jgi:hypothetical protein
MIVHFVAASEHSYLQAAKNAHTIFYSHVESVLRSWRLVIHFPSQDILLYKTIKCRVPAKPTCKKLLNKAVTVIGQR